MCFKLANNSASDSDSVHPVLTGSEATERGSGIGRKRNSSDPSDSDFVKLPTPLPIPIFDLHWIATLLALPIPTPLPIPSLV